MATMFFACATRVLDRYPVGGFAVGKDHDFGDTGTVTDNDPVPAGAGSSGDIAGSNF
jgi:hypothetical protein